MLHHLYNLKFYLKHVPDVLQNTTSVYCLQIRIFKMHQFTLTYYRAILECGVLPKN